MSKEIGPVDLRQSDEHPFLGREFAKPRHFSEASAQAVDQAVKKLVTQAEQQAAQIIEKYRTRLEKLVVQLEEKELLYKEDIEKCLGSSGKITRFPITPEKGTDQTAE